MYLGSVFLKTACPKPGITFPSFNDFSGKQVQIKHGTFVTILEHMGRPFKISKDPKWFAYEVYKILCPCGSICHIFRQNLKKI